MGIYIYSCAVDSNKVSQVYNSKDETLLTQAIKENWFSDNFEEYSQEQALNDIILGKPYKDNVNHVYGYAVITLCHVLGQNLPYSQDIKLGFETDIINQILAEEFNLKNTQVELLLMPDNDDFSFIPPPVDFPLIAVHRQKELQHLAKLFENITITQDMIDDLQNSDEEEKGYAYEHIKGIIENIYFCLENQLDMVSFCH
jgi:hypothetical protein|nr:hypothetical protein [Moraxella osloensis]